MSSGDDVNLAERATDLEPSRRMPPRERILAAAGELFYRHGVRAVGVEAIAEAARTNKMTLYRHFPSKDELVAEYVRGCARRAAACWRELEAAYPDDPRAQLIAWLAAMGEHLASSNERGCALCNVAVELADPDHPARKVIEEFKTAQHRHLSEVCVAAGLAEPDLLADQLFLMLEGARVSVQSIGRAGFGKRFERMGQEMIAAHSR